MATNHGHDHDGQSNPSVQFDKSDLGARGILIFFLVLAIFAVAIHIGVLGMWVGMSKMADKNDPEVSPLAPTTVTPRSGILTNTANINLQKFPEPRLQNDDAGDMQRFLLKETAELTATPHADEQGRQHLPISQAMAEVVNKLPVRSGGQVLETYPGVQHAMPAGEAPAPEQHGQDSEAGK